MVQIEGHVQVQCILRKPDSEFLSSTVCTTSVGEAQCWAWAVPNQGSLLCDAVRVTGPGREAPLQMVQEPGLLNY